MSGAQNSDTKGYLEEQPRLREVQNDIEDKKAGDRGRPGFVQFGFAFLFKFQCFRRKFGASSGGGDHATLNLDGRERELSGLGTPVRSTHKYPTLWGAPSFRGHAGTKRCRVFCAAKKEPERKRYLANARTLIGSRPVFACETQKKRPAAGLGFPQLVLTTPYVFLDRDVRREVLRSMRPPSWPPFSIKAGLVLFLRHGILLIGDTQTGYRRVHHIIVFAIRTRKEHRLEE
jgi:hypothetical protein